MIAQFEIRPDLVKTAMRRCMAAGLLASALVASQGADASNPLPWEKGAVKLGGFISTFDSSLTFGVGDAAATLSGEDALGLDSTLTVFRAEAMYRPGESLRHQVDFSYAGYHRDGSATLSQQVTIGGATFPVGAAVDSVFNFDMIRGGYTYAFLQNERLRVAAGLSVYVIPLEYGISVQTAGGRTFVEGADTLLPFPALAMRGEFQLIPKLFLTAGIEGMYLEISDFSGTLLDGNVGVEYRPWKHLGFGLGYNGVLVEVESSSLNSDYPGGDFAGKVHVEYHGLLIYGKFAF